MVFEILTVVLILISFTIYRYNMGILGSEYIRYTLLFLPTSACLIWLVVNNKGSIGKILKNPMLIRIGNISPYTFLLHGIIVKYSGLGLRFFYKNVSTVIILCVAFALTIIAAKIWYGCHRLSTEKIMI